MMILRQPAPAAVNQMTPYARVAVYVWRELSCAWGPVHGVRCLALVGLPSVVRSAES
jgi:hypothetical protein